MPGPSQLAHRNVRSTNLPFKSNINPTATDPCFVPGSQDLLTSISGYAQRRFGFATAVEPTPTVFNNLKRQFSWNRFDGTFILMACDINSSNQAVVYKLVIGADNSYVSIFTDTGSAEPFDFVVSNNTVYFSNGHLAKAWDPANGIRNWGIAIGSVNLATGPNGVGTGTDVAFAGGTAWANPGNITANDGVFSTVTLTQGSGTSQGPNFPTSASGTTGTGTRNWINPANIEAADGVFTTCAFQAIETSKDLIGQGFGFSIPANATINGILLEVNYKSDTTNDETENSVRLLKNGAVTGNDKSTGAVLPTTATTKSYGSSSDLWGASWTPSDINATTFGALTNYNSAGGLGTASVDFFRITVTYTAAVGAVYSDYLQGTNTALSIGSTNTINGILVEVKGLQTIANANTQLQVQMIKNGNLIGTVKTGTNLPLSNNFVSFGGTSDLWGTTWVANDINQTNFGVSLQAVSNTASSVTWSVDFVRITIYSLGGPAVTLTGTGLTATVGYQYVVCYGNANTGHVSSPSPPSAQIKPTNQAIQITLTASTDAQVNQIRVFRSTDSVASGQNAGVYFEIPTSPFANVNATPTDSAADTALNISSIAPIAGFNDPPPPFFSPVYYAGRIWGFKNNQVFYSSLEENVIGVPEESFPSGIAGNFWNFDQPVQAQAVAGTGLNQALVEFCGGAVYAIIGDTLDTFRKVVVSQRRGCMNRAAVTSLGGMVAWLDSSSQIWASDGNSAQELSVDIRPTIKGLAPTGVSMAFHSAGAFHWLVVAFPNTMMVYDMDTEQWMPPWNVRSNYVFSGQTSPGVYDLLLSNGTKALKLSTTARNDNGVTYQPIAQTNLFAMVPDYGNRFAYNAMGLYDEPTRTGVPWYIQADTNNTTAINDVGILADDDPTISASTYTSIAKNKTDPQHAWNRGQGTNLIQNVYGLTQPMARWASLKFTMPKTDTSDNLYSFFLAYEVKR